MPYTIDTAECLQCATCLPKCPEGAIIPDEPLQRNGMVLHPVHIDPDKCTDCSVCVSEEYWCPGQAIVKA